MCVCVCVCPPRPRPVEAPLDLPSTTFVRDLQKCWQNPWSGPRREMWPGDMNSGRRSASEARRVLVALERRRTARSEQLRCLQPGGKLRLRPVTQLSATSGPRTQAGLAGRLLFRRAVRGRASNLQRLPGDAGWEHRALRCALRCATRH